MKFCAVEFTCTCTVYRDYDFTGCMPLQRDRFSAAQVSANATAPARLSASHLSAPEARHGVLAPARSSFQRQDLKKEYIRTQFSIGKTIDGDYYWIKTTT